MRRLEELQSAILHVRDIAAHEFELEPVTVMRAAKQHCLVLKGKTLLSLVEYLLDDELRFRVAVLDRHVSRLAAALLAGEQVLLVLPFAFGDQAIGAVEDRLGRAIVLLETDDPRRRDVLVRETEDVLDFRGTERVDRLCVVADDRHAGAVRPDRADDLGLQYIRVLVLIDEDVVEEGTDLGREFRVGDQVAPVEEQVVVIERVILLLQFDIAAEQLTQLGFPVAAPGEGLVQGVDQRLFRIHAARIDRETGVFLREAPRLFRQTRLVPHDVHQVCRIAAVEDRETGVQIEVVGIPAQQSIRDRMEGARPGEHVAIHRRIVFAAQRLADDRLDAPRHLLGSPAGECQQEDALGIDPLDDQVRDPMGQGHRLAGAGARDDEQGPRGNATVLLRLPMGSRLALGRVQGSEVVRLEFGGIAHS